MTGFAIRAGNLALEPFTEQDITPRYLGWLNDPEVMRFSNQRFRSHEHASCLAYVRSFAGTPSVFLRIRMVEDDTVVGTMTAYVAVPHGTADMGLLVGERSRWGQGIGLAAWSGLMTHLLRERGLRKVTAGTLACNTGMLRIMERSGMHCEGRRVAQEMVDGKPQDVVYFAKFR